jgi:hypothetical protein
MKKSLIWRGLITIALLFIWSWLSTIFNIEAMLQVASDNFFSSIMAFFKGFSHGDASPVKK